MPTLKIGQVLNDIEVEGASMEEIEKLLADLKVGEGASAAAPAEPAPKKTPGTRGRKATDDLDKEEEEQEEEQPASKKKATKKKATKKKAASKKAAAKKKAEEEAEEEDEGDEGDEVDDEELVAALQSKRKYKRIKDVVSYLIDEAGFEELDDVVGFCVDNADEIPALKDQDDIEDRVTTMAEGLLE